MAVDVDANLKAAAAAATAYPIFQVIFDWTDAGFGDQQFWIDETENVKHLAGSMAAVGLQNSLSAVGNAVVDHAYVTMDNTDGRFSLFYPSGALYGQIGDGAIGYMRAIVKTGYTYGGADYLAPQITGYIVGVKELDEGRLVELEIRDRGAEMKFTRCYSTLKRNMGSRTYISVIVEDWMIKDPLADYGGWGEFYCDSGLFVLGWAWADGDKLWDELSTLADANMGRVWFDNSGNLHWEDGAHWVRENQTDSFLDPLTSQATLGIGDYNQCLPLYNIRDHYSKVIVDYTPRYEGWDQPVYSTAEAWMVPPSETLTYRCTFRHPARSVGTPVHGIDYTAASTGGVDLSADCVLSATFLATSAELEVQNTNASYALVVGGMTFRGKPSFPRPTARYEATDDTSDREISYRIRNPYIQHYRHAEAIGEFALARNQSNIAGVKLTEVPALPWLEVGDRITVTGTYLDPAKADYFITRITWKWGYPYLQDIEAIRVADIYPLTDYFNVGGDISPSSKYGNVAGHGHFFW